MSVEAYWNSLLWELKMMTAISQSQSTLNSYAFFISPNFRLVNVTCLFLSSEILWIEIFFRPILDLSRAPLTLDLTDFRLFLLLQVFLASFWL